GLTQPSGTQQPIGNLVWNDLDGDGVQDAGEASIPGVTVELWNAPKTKRLAVATTNQLVQDVIEAGLGGVTVELWNAARTQRIGVVATGTDGFYAIPAHRPGGFQIRVVAPPGYHQRGIRAVIAVRIVVEAARDPREAGRETGTSPRGAASDVRLDSRLAIGFEGDCANAPDAGIQHPFDLRLQPERPHQGEGTNLPIRNRLGEPAGPAEERVSLRDEV